MKNISLLRTALGWLALSAVVAGCDPGIDGNGDRTEEVRETASFSRVRSNCELDVQVVQGDEPSVIVSVDSNLQEYVTTRIDSDTLYVDVTENVAHLVDGPHVLVTVPELTAAKLDGSGRMTLTLDEPELPLDLYLSGSGDLRFTGKTAALGAYLSGSGDVRLEGETGDVELKLSGSGSIRGQHLASANAAIELSGSGNVAATVQGSVSVTLSGSGNVDLFGGASLDSYRDTGSGEVVEH